jgi:hypothetical protein
MVYLFICLFTYLLVTYLTTLSVALTVMSNGRVTVNNEF